MKNISLRKFRVEIVDLRESVEVSRRDPEGNIQLLGYWTPYSAQSSRVEPPLPAELGASRSTGVPIIRTPKEAALAAPVSPRAYSKAAQAGKRR